MIGLKNGHIRKNLTQKMVNPRDTAGNTGEEETYLTHYVGTKLNTALHMLYMSNLRASGMLVVVVL